MGKYSGHFCDGQFHGSGTMLLKDGGKFEGDWFRGKFVSGKFVFADGLEYQDGEGGWEYCTTKDPRFYSEIQAGVPKEGPLIQDTADPRPALLPLGCFDCIDGYFDPVMGAVRDFRSHAELRRPDQEEVRWIRKHCRVAK